MHTISQNQVKSIAGLSIRTNNNDDPNTIPELWQSFYRQNVAETLTDSASSAIYALYSEFEHEGISNEGEYTFLIGLEIKSKESLPSHLDCIEIPAGDYLKFDVPDKNPEQIYPTWQQIWSRDDLDNTLSL